MHKTLVIPALLLVLAWAGTDALAGRGNGKGRGRGEGRNAKTNSECPREEAREGTEDTCPLCGSTYLRDDEKKLARKKGAGRPESAQAERQGSRKGRGGNANRKSGRGGRSDCDDGRGRGRGRGSARGEGRGNGRGNARRNGRGNGCRDGQGQGRGRGNGFGDGRRQGRGNGRGDGQGQGRGNGRGDGQGQGRGGDGARVLTGDETEAKPASKEYLARLQATLEEELFARDYYRSAYESLDGFRRFGNLSRAEQNHADAIAAAIERFGGKPVLSHSQKIIVPDSVAAADAVCTVIEKKVIKIYKGLIRDCPDETVRKSLERIQQANYRHLSVVSR